MGCCHFFDVFVKNSGFDFVNLIFGAELAIFWSQLAKKILYCNKHWLLSFLHLGGNSNRLSNSRVFCQEYNLVYLEIKLLLSEVKYNVIIDK